MEQEQFEFSVPIQVIDASPKPSEVNLFTYRSDQGNLLLPIYANMFCPTKLQVHFNDRTTAVWGFGRVKDSRIELLGNPKYSGDYVDLSLAFGLKAAAFIPAAESLGVEKGTYIFFDRSPYKSGEWLGSARELIGIQHYKGEEIGLDSWDKFKEKHAARETRLDYLLIDGFYRSTNAFHPERFAGMTVKKYETPKQSFFQGLSSLGKTLNSLF